MKIESAAFKNGEYIPKKCTCEGEDASPPLAFADVPKEAHTLALICDDPDAPAGVWSHWVLFDIPPKTARLPENLPKTQFVLNTAAQGLSDFGRLGYGGPCPPPGKAHRYFFRLYALKGPLGLKPGADRAQLLAAMEGKTLAQAELVGLYRR